MVVHTLEQHWEILRQIDLQKMPILAKKSSFQMIADFGILYVLRVHIGSAIQRFFSTSAYFVNGST